VAWYRRAMRAIHTIVILTGAGISAESGLATFRGPGGLWEGHRVEEESTPIIDYRPSTDGDASLPLLR
jgi:NAD-dependent deacetylase